MKQPILFGMCILILLSGCSNQEKIYYNEQGDMIKMTDECLIEMRCQIPNTTQEMIFEPELLAHEMCYDLVNDPDNVKEGVDKIFEEHPDDWENYLTPNKLDPKITFIPNNNISEIICEKIYIDRETAHDFTS